ncbi:protease inhibitor I42 family protein [Actinoplanes sp. NPDC049548]|uniref:protease inhibitor I42 family protein n=1 Tax=Actinoplanes sp. NPDC049548 TaxID=3155152 RepID=UPI003419A504
MPARASSCASRGAAVSRSRMRSSFAPPSRRGTPARRDEWLPHPRDGAIVHRDVQFAVVNPCGGSSMHTLTETDSGREISLRPAESVVVELEENATTGFQWTAAASAGCVVVEDSGSLAPSGAAPGAAGARTFQVRAATPGTCDVEFRLGRSWESDRPPARSVRMRFRVE